MAIDFLPDSQRKPALQTTVLSGVGKGVGFLRYPLLSTHTCAFSSWSSRSWPQVCRYSLQFKERVWMKEGAGGCSNVSILKLQQLSVSCPQCLQITSESPAGLGPTWLCPAGMTPSLMAPCSVGDGPALFSPPWMEPCSTHSPPGTGCWAALGTETETGTGTCPSPS